MSSIPVSAARDGFSEIVNRVAYGKERIYPTRHGKDVTCIISIDEARLLDLLEEELGISRLSEPSEPLEPPGLSATVADPGALGRPLGPPLK